MTYGFGRKYRAWLCAALALIILLSGMPMRSALAVPSDKVITIDNDTYDLRGAEAYDSFTLTVKGNSVIKHSGSSFCDNVKIIVEGGTLTLERVRINAQVGEPTIVFEADATLILSGKNEIKGSSGQDVILVKGGSALIIREEPTGELHLTAHGSDAAAFSIIENSSIKITSGIISTTADENVDDVFLGSGSKFFITSGSFKPMSWTENGSNDTPPKYYVEVQCRYNNDNAVANHTLSYASITARTDSYGNAYMWLPENFNYNNINASAEGYNIVRTIDGFADPPIVTLTFTPKNNDSSLKSLEVESYTFDNGATFNKQTTEYFLTVDDDESTVKITGAPTSGKATRSIEKKKGETTTSILASGSGSFSVDRVALDVGENVYYIIVVAENGETTTYTLTITRGDTSDPGTDDPTATPTPTPKSSTSTTAPAITPLPADSTAPTIISATASARDKLVILSAFALDDRGGQLYYRWQFLQDGKWLDLANGVGSFIVKDNLLPGKEYTFRVLIYDGAGNYVTSDELKVTANLPRNAREGVAMTSFSTAIPAIISGKKVAVRSGPMTNYQELSVLYRGDTVYVNGIQGSWACVTWKGVESSAWIHAGYLNWDDRPPISAYLTEPVFVRSGPGLNYSAIGTLPRGTFLDLYNRRGNYYMIIANGMPCYIHARYIMML